MERLLRPLVFKFGSKPVGIWLAWAALAWAAGLMLKATSFLWGMCAANCLQPLPLDLIVSWVLLIGATIALLRRRCIAVTLSGMALVSVLQGQSMSCCPFGIVLAAFGFIGLLANRRWFDERLPRISW